MLPDEFDFAMMPEGTGDFSLKEVGMMSSTIEDIDYAIVSWLKEDLNLSTKTNEGYNNVPVLWQAPERAYQVKNEKELRDDGGALKLPLISIERTNITKDPAKKGSFQAHLYSVEKDGRPGRIVIAKRIVQDKTRNFAVASGTRTNTGAVRQRYTKRENKKVVIQTVSIPIPVYVELEYKITIKTEYQQQINELTTPFITRTGQINAFTMKRKGHVYEGFVQQGFLSADGTEQISLLYDFASADFLNRANGAKEEIKKVEFELVLGNDYRIEVLIFDLMGETALVGTAGASGNIMDNTNVAIIRIEVVEKVQGNETVIEAISWGQMKAGIHLIQSNALDSNQQ